MYGPSFSEQSKDFSTGMEPVDVSPQSYTGRVVCNTGMELAEFELRTHKSIVLSLLVHKTVTHDSGGHQKQKDDTELQEQWARR